LCSLADRCEPMLDHVLGRARMTCKWRGAPFACVGLRYRRAEYKRSLLKRAERTLLRQTEMSPPAGHADEVGRYEASELRELVRHIIPVRAYMVEKLRAEFAARPFAGEIRLSRVRGSEDLVPSSEGAGTILEASNSLIKVRVEEVEDARTLLKHVASSTLSARVADERMSPARRLEMAWAIANEATASTDIAERTKAVRTFLSTVWTPNMLKEVIGASKPRKTTAPSVFAEILKNEAEGHPKAGIFQELLKFDELVCSEKVRPSGKNFDSNNVVSVKFIRAVYGAPTRERADEMISKWISVFTDKSTKRMPSVEKYWGLRGTNSKDGGESEETDDEEEEQGNESALTEFENFVEEQINMYGKRVVVSIFKRVAKKYCARE